MVSQGEMEGRTNSSRFAKEPAIQFSSQALPSQDISGRVDSSRGTVSGEITIHTHPYRDGLESTATVGIPHILVASNNEGKKADRGSQSGTSSADTGSDQAETADRGSSGILPPSGGRTAIGESGEDPEDKDGDREEHLTSESLTARSMSLRDLSGPRIIQIRPAIREGAAAVEETPVSLEHRVEEGDTVEDFLERFHATWEELKKERSELSGVFTGEVWQHVGDVRRRLTQEGRALGVHSGVGYPGSAEGDSPLRPLEKPQDPSELTLDQLKSATLRTFREGSAQWKAEKDARLERPEAEWTVEDVRYKRLNDIVRFRHTVYPKLPADAAEHIDLGAETAINIAWDLFGVSPETFEDTYERIPNQAEVDELMVLTESLAVHLGSGNNELVSTFNNFLRGLGPTESTRGHPYLRQHFTIVEDRVENPGGEAATRKRMAIKQEALDTFAALMAPEPDKPNKITFVEPHSDTTRCVAFAVEGNGLSSEADGGEGMVKSVFAEMQGWNLAIAREFWLQRFPRE